MKPFVSAMILVLAATVPLHAQDEGDDTPSLDDTPHITIVGTASKELAPDLATIRLGVKSHKSDAIAAADAVAFSAKSIVDAARAMGVSPADVATQSVTLQQSFEDLRDAQGRITGTRPSGFDASNSVAIRFRDLARAGQIAQAMIDKGANSIEGVAFTVEHPQPVEEELEVEAAANAKRQAEAITQSVGAKLGRILLIVRPIAENAPPGRTLAVSRATAMRPAEIPLEGGSAKFTAQMQITWALER